MELEIKYNSIMKKIHRHIIIMLFIICGIFSAHAQTTYTVTDAGAGNPGSADIIIAQAVISANSGQDVIVYMNASGLCSLTNTISITLTAGSLTIEPSPSATVTQGFLNASGTITSFNSSSTGTPSSLIGLILPTTVTLSSYVFVRQCEIVSSSQQANFPIHNTNYQNVDLDPGISSVTGTPLTSINMSLTYFIFSNNFTGYGDIYIDFYKTNANGDLLDYIGTDFIPASVSSNFANNPYTLNIPSGIIINSGDRIAGTLTSGQGGYLGTSNAFYFNASPPPCCGNLTFPLTYNGGLTCLSQSLESGLAQNVPLVPGTTLIYDNSSLPHNGSSATSCIGTIVELSIPSTATCACGGSFVYTWDFGDGYTTTGCAATHSYTAVGNYTISVVATSTIVNQCGPSTIQFPLHIYNGCHPANLHIGTSQTNGTVTIQSPFCLGDITFNGDISQPCDVNPASTFSWTFANGSSTTSLSFNDGIHTLPFTQTFTALGSYGYTLALVSPNCPLSVATGTFQVNTTCGTPTVCCPPSQFSFTPSGVNCWNPAPLPTGIAIGAGPGRGLGGSTSSAANIYLGSGYTCSGGTFGLSMNNSCSCAGDINYTWDFGDGTSTATGCSVTHYYLTAGSYTTTLVISSASSSVTCASQTLTIGFTVLQNCCPPSSFNINAFASDKSSTFCPGEPINFNTNDFNSCLVYPATAYSWTFSDGYTTTQAPPISHVFSNSGIYTYTLNVNAAKCGISVGTGTIQISNCSPPPPCDVCIGSFAPIPGQQYMFGGWVKQGTSSSSNALITYTTPNVILTFTGGGNVGPFYAKGAIIDGWQRIEEQFTVPASATDITVNLINGGSTDNVFFDDIRIHPFNSNLKSFVYDPINLRLMAELDQNNYATFYEYDEEGKLIRVKKETERGVFTIKEAFNSTQK